MVSRALRRVTAITVLAGMSVACSAVLGISEVPDPGDGGADAAGIDPNDPNVAGAAAYAAADCKRFTECNRPGFDLAFRDVPYCEQRALSALLWILTLPGTAATGSRLRECATRMAALACDDYNSSRGQLTCALKGDLDDGQTCLDNSQCKSGFCPSLKFSCAACHEPPQAGDPCVDGRCAAGLLCDPSSICVQEVPEGSPCGPTQPCAFPLNCDGVCRAPPAVAGTPCGSPTTPNCDLRKNFFCSADDGVCEPFVTSSAGGPCGPGQICRQGAACVDGFCSTPASPGDPCHDQTGPFCTYPDQCVDGTCTAPVGMETCH